MHIAFDWKSFVVLIIGTHAFYLILARLYTFAWLSGAHENEPELAVPSW